jgi:DNA-binding IclR family transcriptional regulator
MSEHVPPNLRAIRILEVLSESRTAPTPTELNARLGWPKQTIHRLCQTLIEAGILEKHDKRLYPGHRASPLALPTGPRGLSGATRFCCSLRAIRVKR